MLHTDCMYVCVFILCIMSWMCIVVESKLMNVRLTLSIPPLQHHKLHFPECTSKMAADCWLRAPEKEWRLSCLHSTNKLQENSRRTQQALLRSLLQIHQWSVTIFLYFMSAEMLKLKMLNVYLQCLILLNYLNLFNCWTTAFPNWFHLMHWFHTVVWFNKLES